MSELGELTFGDILQPQDSEWDWVMMYLIDGEDGFVGLSMQDDIKQDVGRIYPNEYPEEYVLMGEGDA